MKARLYKESKDLKTILKWWKECKTPVDFNYGKIFLSDTGIIISDKGKDICACWLVITNSDVCHLGWFIAERYHDKKEEALNYLIEVSKRFLRLHGYKYLTIYTENSGIENKLLKKGFVIGDENVKQLIGVL